MIASIKQKRWSAGGTSLTQHKRINLEEKPDQCNICSKSFYQRRNFTTHTRIHGGEKPYHCDISGESFPVNSCLTRPKHTQTLEKTSFR
ncbi:---NA--- [Octopus vulgaris]|uniref:---NA n=1 Tax=Octopus vulgaris TaxID=6645 RepID=A0AA36BX43_OCTVU|nr:---NA--- [Octopus vulgaris]